MIVDDRALLLRPGKSGWPPGIAEAAQWAEGGVGGRKGETGGVIVPCETPGILLCLNDSLMRPRVWVTPWDSGALGLAEGGVRGRRDKLIRLYRSWQGLSGLIILPSIISCGFLLYG